MQISTETVVSLSSSNMSINIYRETECPKYATVLQAITMYTTGRKCKMDKMAALNDPNFVYVFATASFSQ